MALQYKYNPEIPEVFRCRVPLPGTNQAYLLNGHLRETLKVEEKLELKAEDATGFNVKVYPKALVADTLQIISVRDSEDISDLRFSNSLSFGESSDSAILLCTHTLSMDEFRTESDISINLSEGSRANIVIMQNEHNGSSHKMNFNIKQAKDSYLRMNIISLHGAKLENFVNTALEGEGAVCELNGLYLVDGKQEITTSVNMMHLVPRCHSSQLFKGILDNESKAVFSGLINVAKDAQKTEAYQANHNLLLSRKAKVYTQPQLEIYADDVKCSHGATSGRLDELALFYMRSRGIGLHEAKLLQQLAFVYDVLEKINNETLRLRLQELVESRLRGEFGQCTNCSMNCC
ncbi:MAG: SufD family Fe-S cluster assembly protein [Rikenellaceae bacterium]|nr:SufD family Fe-S cluster assembly protein [Rikenellaceae bacterium]